jgi:hypothetical protein
MRLISTIRIYYFALAILVVGWIANLVQALRQPNVSWRDASGFSVLALMFIALSALIQARKKLKQSSDTALKTNAARYVLAGIVVGVALGSFLSCFERHLAR